jgi:hypothetical protein
VAHLSPDIPQDLGLRVALRTGLNTSRTVEQLIRRYQAESSTGGAKVWAVRSFRLEWRAAGRKCCNHALKIPTRPF